MKVKHYTAAAMAAACFAVIGCDNNSEPAPVATPTEQTTADKAKSAAEDVKSTIETGTEKATEAATEAGNAVAEQAQKLYDDAVAAIKGANFQDAEKYVDQLKSLKDKLPADWQTKVDDVAKMLSDAKAKLSSVPGLPG